MKQSIAKKWIAALESGRYRKGQNVLRKKKTDTYCCLGVLCELYRQEYPKKSEWINSKETEGALAFVNKENTSDHDDSVLPIFVQNWAGIASTTGMLFGAETTGFNALTVINDKKGKGAQSFKSVIEAIKAHWKEL